MTRYPLPHGEIIRARVEDVYPTIPDGTVTLLHSDGPYGMSKAAWDKVRDLAAFYRPHIAEWSRLCAPSASVYLWNTAEGWAAIHPEMVAAGWRFETLIVWNKIGAHPARLGAASSRQWPDVTEVCGHYQRGTPPHANPPGAENVWSFDATNEMRGGERLITGKSVHRTGGGDRYYECAEPLHPCQKPLLFAERVILASSRPGDVVFEPFGGTCRIAVANERLARFNSADARRTITVEMDEDGRDYIGAVLRSMGADLGAPGTAKKQVGLFPC
jgi:DNA modification methylase